ncbi:hypothetical protein [Alkaliphilus peptidifermentans]|uniref:Uncharacterized protein n=1 Tax=Alkaliphilus peptidifermentans DSM 18978 TaxID=1120976 RepID=A0A1G5EUX9_9FIRM|nr:hypothetical protein [Alkaliphilus peptidifermentans]SCY30581.1 hypothetical protein SAMN03080606_01230 [Alkaliphilus peptidifermentans DSM 18978]
MLLNEEINAETVGRHGEKPIVLGFQQESIKERMNIASPFDEILYSLELLKKSRCNLILAYK